jgi:hypothetical protein
MSVRLIEAASGSRMKAVAGAGDRALATGVAAGVFRGNEAQISHQGTRFSIGNVFSKGKPLAFGPTLYELFLSKNI